MFWYKEKQYNFLSITTRPRKLIFDSVYVLESLVKIEIPVIDAEPSFLPSRSPAGVDITHKAVILNHVSEQREFITVNMKLIKEMRIWSKWASLLDIGTKASFERLYWCIVSGSALHLNYGLSLHLHVQQYFIYVSKESPV